MATVNFSVPEDVKDRFNKAFEGQNKSQIIAQLMERAVEEQAMKKRRSKAIEALSNRRAQRPPASASRIRKAREIGRP
jgi:metal-responsive CopG/Arc/MetJ family transcriptional regulator